MNELELIKNLKALKTGEPNAQWVERNREILLSQVSAQQAAPVEIFSKEGANYSWQVAKLFFPGRLVYRTVGAIALVFVLLLSSSITTVWAERSLPGDMLYQVKLTTEKVQLGLTANQEDKTKLKVEFAGKRVAEIKKISEQEQPTADKVEKIKQSLENYQANITDVDTHLEEMKTGSTAQEAVDMASLVNNQVENYSRDLQKNTEAIDAEPSVMTSALAVSEKAADKAVGIIIEKNQSGEVATPEAEIQDLVTQKIDQAKGQVATLNKTIEVINTVAPVVAGAPAAVPATAESKEVLNKAEAVTETASKNLNEAEALLQSGDAVASLQKVQEVKQITKETQAAVETTVAPVLVTPPANLNVNAPVNAAK